MERLMNLQSVEVPRGFVDDELLERLCAEPGHIKPLSEP